MAILKFKTPKKKAEELAQQNYIKVSDDGKTYQLIDKATGQVVTTDYMRQSGSNELKPFSNRVSRGFERLAEKYVPKEEPKKSTSNQTTEQKKSDDTEIADKWKSLFDSQNQKIDELTKEVTALKSKKGTGTIMNSGPVKKETKDQKEEIKNNAPVNSNSFTWTVTNSQPDQNNQVPTVTSTPEIDIPSYDNDVTVADIFNLKKQGVPYVVVGGKIYSTPEIEGNLTNKGLFDARYGSTSVFKDIYGSPMSSSGMGGTGFTTKPIREKPFRTPKEAEYTYSKYGMDKQAFRLEGQPGIFMYISGKIQELKNPLTFRKNNLIVDEKGMPDFFLGTEQ